MSLSSASRPDRSLTTILLRVSTKTREGLHHRVENGAPCDELAHQVLALVDQVADAGLLAAQRVGDLLGALEELAQLIAPLRNDRRQ